MHNPLPTLTTALPLLAAALILSCVSCATKPPANKGGDRTSGDRYTMAGYEFSARKGEDTRPEIVARFGPPLAQETAGATGQYHILGYPISGQSEKLLLLFHGEEMLGVFREGSRASLDRTVTSHQRVQGGRVVLFRAHYEAGKAVYFTAQREQLSKVPKWKPGDAAPPPLSEAQAGTIATEWRKRQAPGLAGNSKVRKVQEILSFPGVSYYQVDLGNFQAPPHLRRVLVLMDGTVVAGESEASK